MAAPHLNRVKATTVALTQNVWTKIAPATARQVLMINNTSGASIRLQYGANPHAVLFDGSNDYINLDAGGTGLLADTDLLAAKKGTVKAQINLSASASGENVFFTWSNAVGDYQLEIGVTSAAKLYATLTMDGTVQWTVLNTAALVKGEWYTIKLSHDGVSPVLYVDNEMWPQTLSVDTAPAKWFTDVAVPAVARLGCKIDSSSGASFWKGMVRGVEIYTGVATQYTRKTIAVYNADEGTAVALTDTSGNGYNGAFGATVEAPTWAAYEYGQTLVSTANEWYDAVVPLEPVWAFTAAGTPGTVEVMDGR